MSEPLPEILVTNDDGIYAPGLTALSRALADLGPVAVVAPDAERSAFGHAITMGEPLRASEALRDGRSFGTAVSGTPADCVKLAVHTLLPRRPRLVVSGINPGPNTGTHVLYSGTVSAAREGTIFDIPSLAVSLCTWDRQGDFTSAAVYARAFARLVLTHGLPAGVMLNLNIPALPAAEIRGVRITRLARFRYHDRYEVRQDPRGRTYYWLTGEDAEVLDPSPDADAVAVEAGYVSVTPLAYDLTCRECIPDLQGWLAEMPKVF
jgi:5'-nucleotidase